MLVPGYTDGLDDLLALGAFIQTLQGIEKVDILPYHRMGVYKWQEMGLFYKLEGVQTPSEREVRRAYGLIEQGRKM